MSATATEECAAASEAYRQYKANAKISVEQREIMLGFMKAHPQLATGRLQGPGAAVSKTRLLSQLAGKLNACASGATKPDDKWLKSWQDWRSDVKQKAGKLRRHQNGTGGGPPCKVVLTVLEEELLDVIGEVVVVGDTRVPDFLENPAASATVVSPMLVMADSPLIDADDIDLSDTMVIPMSTSASTVDEWLAPEPVRGRSANKSGSPSPAASSSQSESSISKRRRKTSSMSELDERLLTSTENQEINNKRLITLKEMRTEAADREAAAAERQADAAERQAAVTERMAAVAERQIEQAETIGKAVTSGLRCLELYLESKAERK